MNDWNICKIGDICKSNCSTYNAKENWEFVNYLDTGNITKNVIDNIQFIDLKTDRLPSRAKRKVKYNSIVYSTVRPNKRHYGIIKRSPEHFLVSTGFTVLDVDESIADADYIYYYLSKSETVELLHSIAEQSVSTYPSIKSSDIENLDILLPDLKTQKKTAKILKILDKKLSTNSELNNKMLDMCETLYFNLCKDAKVSTLDNLLELIETGSRPKGGAQENGIPSIGAEKIEQFGLYNYFNEKYISKEYFEKLKHGIVKSGDVLLYKDGAYTGKSSMVLDGFPHSKCAINEHVFLLRTKNNYAQSFLYFTLHNPNIYENIHTLACGKAAQPGLNQRELISIKIKLPNENDIIEFEKIVNPMMRLIAKNALESRKLALLQELLISKLIPSKIQV